MSQAKALLHKLARVSRQLHVWISLTALVLVLHFAATGFVMRHPGWFSLEETTTEDLSATLPENFPATPDRLDVTEALRRNPGLHGAVTSYEPDAADGTLRVVFERPGERADVTVAPLPGGPITGTREYNGLAKHFTSLHTGDRAGGIWGLVIDGGALGLLVVAITGVGIAISHPKMRRQALVLGCIGLAGLLAIWFWLVP